MNFEFEELTEKIIGAAIQVHKKLGPGFLESVYEKALIWELKKQELKVKEQYEIVIKYDEEEIGNHRLDLLVEDTIVVELKTVKKFEDIHFAIVKSYLKAAKLKHGPLINFAKVIIDIKRVIFET